MTLYERRKPYWSAEDHHESQTRSAGTSRFLLVSMSIVRVAKLYKETADVERKSNRKVEKWEIKNSLQLYWPTNKRGNEISPHSRDHAL